MKNTGASLFFLLLMSWSFASPLTAAFEPTVRTTSDKNELAPGEAVEVTVQIQWEQNEKNDITIHKITPPAAKELELKDTIQSVSSQLAEDTAWTTRIFTYHFKALTKGDAVLSPAVFEYSFTSHPEEKRLLKGEEIRFRIVPLSKKILNYLSIILGFSMLAGITSAGILTILRYRKTHGHKQHQPKEAPFELETLTSLSQLHALRIAGNIPSYYEAAHKLICEYIKIKYGIYISDDRSEEKLISAEKQSVPAKLRELWRQWSSECDRVRFAGVVPTQDEQKKLIRETERYFKSLIPKNNPVNEIEMMPEKIPQGGI